MWSRIGKSINLYVLAALVTLIFSACGQSAKATTMHLIKTSGDVGVSDQAGSDFMSVTATELKNNLGKYLLLSATEDIFITKNGKVVAKLTNPYEDRVKTVKSLFGILPKDADIEAVRQERLGQD